ncbi:MAG: hypothetical protein LBC76_11230 [Treponema sp.]|jgi:hypothetical protein|nr:hypothetical protein [Treponema sp.]
MKKKIIKLLAAFALSLSIVFTMTAAKCGSKSEGGAASGAKSGNEAVGKSEPDTLTINGLPKQELTAVVVSADKDLSTLLSVGVAALAFEAGGENSADSGNVFELSGMFSGEPFAGTGKYKVILINNNFTPEKPTDKNNPMFRTAEVNFKNGGASVKFNSFAAVTKEFLTNLVCINEV